MKSKIYLKTVLSLVIIMLILIGGVNFAIDPLFQYHKPWFGLEPVITNERYQNPGIAKNFDYENVIIGNSLSENFKISDVESVFGGETVKLTASGSHTNDWVYLLDIIKNKSDTTDNILFNLDPYILRYSSKELKHEIPAYLYNQSYFDDVKYLFNFSIMKDFTYNILNKNMNNDIPEYDTAFCVDHVAENHIGKEFVLSNYERPQITNYNKDNQLLEVANNNIDLLIPYIESMPDTEFNFFISPFSMVFWDNEVRTGNLANWEECYLQTIGRLLQYENVTIYFWNDQDMLDRMSDLNNYCDEAHYTMEMCEYMTVKMSVGSGKLTLDDYKKEVIGFFDFLETYDYDSLVM